MREAILIVGGGLLQIPAIHIAQRMGLAAIVSDGDPEAPGMNVADEAIPLDIYDTGGHAQCVKALAKRYRLLGVFAEGADVEVTVAMAAETLGVPGIPVEAARRCKNKVLMRRALDRAGLCGVKWRESRTKKEARCAAEEVGLSVAVKAVDNCGSRGFTKVTEFDQIDLAFERAILASTTGTALIEQCLSGPEQSVEILFDRNGRCHWLNIVDRPFSGGPWAIELGHVNPTQLDLSIQQQLFTLAQQAAIAVGVHFGAFKVDTILTSKGPEILEVTARLSGGFDCQYTTPLASGRNFIRPALMLAIGRDVDSEDLRPQWKRYAAAWAVLSKPGYVRSISGVDRALACPGVRHVFLRVKKGDVIRPYVDCAARPAFVIAEGNTMEEVMARVNVATSAIAIETV